MSTARSLLVTLFVLSFFSSLFSSVSCDINELQTNDQVKVWTCHLPAVTVTQMLPVSGEGAISSHAIEQHLRTATSFVDPQSLHWSCIDGRSHEPQLSTPGGDSGEFITALAIYEREMQKIDPSVALTADSVRQLLDEYLYTHVSPSRRWYLHSDLTTLAKLQKAMNDSQFDPSGPVPIDKQAAALGLLTQPGFVGCSHIKLMLTRPDDYQVRADIVRWYLAAFFDFMWNREAVGTKINHITDLEELDGPHDERAVVNLYPDYTRVADTSSECMGKAPLIPPATPKDSLFIYDEGFVRVGVRNDIATFFASKIGIPPHVITDQVGPLVHMQLGLTIASVGVKTSYDAVLLVDRPEVWEPAVPEVQWEMLTFSVVLMVFFGLGLAIAIFIGLRKSWREDLEHYTSLV